MIARLKAWALGLLAFAAMLGGAWLLGRQKGKQAGAADAQDARNEAANAQAKANQLEIRHEVDAQVAQLPDAPAQPLAAADPATAAGKLRAGWLRD